MTALALAETTKANKPALTTGNSVAAMVPNSVESAWRLSEVIARSGMAPKTYGTDPHKIMVGMLAGMEIGLTPFAALQSIAVINGNPSLWGDGALALVLASNLVEDMDEQDDGNVATCTIKRVGRATPIIRQFSNDDAAKAGLKGKAGPWTQYPARMRQMRARAFALRDGFPDVLKGLRVAEEARDYAEFGPAAAVPANGVNVPQLTGAALLEQAGYDDADTVQAEPVAATDPRSPAGPATQPGTGEATHGDGAGASPNGALPYVDDGVDQQAAAEWTEWAMTYIKLIKTADRTKLATMATRQADSMEHVAEHFPKLHRDVLAAIADRNAALDGEAGE